MRIWRKICPTSILKLQREALSINSIYLLREIGPTAFLVQEEHKKATIKVMLGTKHRCSCKYFQHLNDLCIHICWILLRKLKIAFTNPISFQIGFTEQEIIDCLKPKKTETINKFLSQKIKNSNGLEERTTPKRIDFKTSCPICLENIEDHNSNIVHCKYSCGNGVHYKCMIILAKHQIKSNEITDEYVMISCPLCRGDFMTLKQLKQAFLRISKTSTMKQVVPLVEHDVTCKICEKSPLFGNVYRCSKCSQVIICSCCLKREEFQNMHNNHNLFIKTNPSERWKSIKL